MAAEARARARRTNPDSPPWGVAAASALLLASYFMEPALRFAVVRAFRLLGRKPSETFVFAYQLAELLLAHLLTLALVWAFVTGLGRRPFWRTLGWSWPARLRVKEVEGKRFAAPWVTFFLGLFVAALGGVAAGIIGGPRTRLEESFEVSPWVVVMTIFTAVATAPFVEEFVYRGVLYPALQRAFGGRFRGKAAAVVAVAVPFFYIHLHEYSASSNSPHAGRLTAIALAALAFTAMRAYSRRLLPSYVMHLVFNVFGSVTLCWSLLYKYLTQGGP